MGTPIEFYVNDQKAYCSDGGDWEESYPFQAGGITALDLWVGSLATPGTFTNLHADPDLCSNYPQNTHLNLNPGHDPDSHSYAYPDAVWNGDAYRT